MPVRRLIIENNIHEAFQALEPLVCGQEKNDLHLLWTQFTFWEKQEKAKAGPSLVERNRILYAVLKIVSELEGNKVLKEMEVNLMKDYEQVGTLTKQGTIDKIMLWMVKEYPEKFNERIGYEVKNLNVPLTITFDKPVLNAYIIRNNLDITPGYLFEYVSNKYNTIPCFFSEWLKYHDKKNKVVDGIQNQIRHNEKNYSKKLLMMGLLGGVSGAALVAFFGDHIDISIDGDNDDDD